MPSLGNPVLIHPYRPLTGLWVELPRRSHNNILLVRSRSPPDPGRFIRTILDVWARPGINNPDDEQPQHNPDSNPLEDDAADDAVADDAVVEPPPPGRDQAGPEPEDQGEDETEAEAEAEAETVVGGEFGWAVEPEPETETEAEVEPEVEAEVPAPWAPVPVEPPPAWDPETFLRDPRTQAQRNHDAIKAVLRDTLASKRLGQFNGLPVTLVVSTTLRELEAGAGIAVTGAGTRMPMRDLIRLAEHAHHYLIVYRHHTAEPLYLGRTKRLATKAQRLLLYNRDRGCTRPGCTQAACRCQAHHANPSWKDGGLTDAPDLGLGCGPDNQLAELGWTNTIDPTTGRVHWHPPPLMDTGSDTLNHHFHPEELFPPPQPGDEDSP
ncbi:MAG: HNH endonuclease [Mycolicibacterium frederiksbergense]|nr:HNH endonuclease [Mycolicibacterium frederiksbergense]